MSNMKIADSSSKLAGLSSLTGLSEAELQARAKATATHTIARLSSLDAALVANSSSSSAQATQDAFAALSAGNIEPHLLEDPLTSFRAGGSRLGFAAASSSSSSSSSSTTSSVLTSAQLEAAGRSGAARVKGFVDETESTLATTSDTTASGDDTESTDSMNIEFEQLKNELNKLSQMQTAMSNVLNSIHTSAMSIINNLKA